MVWNQDGANGYRGCCGISFGHYSIKVQGNWGGIHNIKGNLQNMAVVVMEMLSPSIKSDPLSSGSLRDHILPPKIFSLGSDMSSLFVNKSNTEKGKEYSCDGEPQIGTVQRVFAGVIGILCLVLAGWSLYRAPIQDSIAGWFGRMLIVGTTMLLAVVFLNSAFFDARIWLRLLQRACN